LDVQAPYRWNIRRLKPGYVLDIGCGIGRNLTHLHGHGVGIDHNEQSVKIAREQGIVAYTPQEFQMSDYRSSRQFDSILFAHVAEHMTVREAVQLLTIYTPCLKIGGKLIVITPQEAGYKSDSTHVEFIDFQKSFTIIRELGFHVIWEYSFPFPRFFGRLFLYNEFVSIGIKEN